jgi:hypothetical protein
MRYVILNLAESGVVNRTFGIDSGVLWKMKEEGSIGWALLVGCR